MGARGRSCCAGDLVQCQNETRKERQVVLVAYFNSLTRASKVVVLILKYQ